ncbi:hypothetical protein [Synechococcus sp. PCC 7335]
MSPPFKDVQGSAVVSRSKVVEVTAQLMPHRHPDLRQLILTADLA